MNAVGKRVQKVFLYDCCDKLRHLLRAALCLCDSNISVTAGIEKASRLVLTLCSLQNQFHLR